jgi:hypothetical protein
MRDAMTVRSGRPRSSGKPVVPSWGFGFDEANKAWPASACLDVVNWLESQGCYVIGGVPSTTRPTPPRPN